MEEFAFAQQRSDILVFVFHLPVSKLGSLEISLAVKMGAAHCLCMSIGTTLYLQAKSLDGLAIHRTGAYITICKLISILVCNEFQQESALVKY